MWWLVYVHLTTVLWWPFWQARWRGVEPLWSVAVTSARCSSSSVTNCVLPAIYMYIHNKVYKVCLCLLLLQKKFGVLHVNLKFQHQVLRWIWWFWGNTTVRYVWLSSGEIRMSIIWWLWQGHISSDYRIDYKGSHPCMRLCGGLWEVHSIIYYYFSDRDYSCVTMLAVQ